MSQIREVSLATSRLILAAVVVTLIALVVRPKDSTEAPSSHTGPALDAVDVLRFAKSSDTVMQTTGSYQPVRQLAYVDLRTPNLVAFEENRWFVYAVGEVSVMDGHPGVDRAVRWVRRFIFLRPATFIIDDQAHSVPSGHPIGWSLHSRQAPQITGKTARITEGDSELLCETVLPLEAKYQRSRWLGSRRLEGESGLEIIAGGQSGKSRFVQVLYARGRGDQSAARSELSEPGAEIQLTVSAAHRIFRLTLPPASVGAGDITLSDSNGKTIQERRPLPSGILPHGPEGMRMLDSWDASYRGGRRPLWDAGRPSGELQRVVEKGIVRGGRAVDLGCGSGTDAIYLASKGFDVTGIDVAPTALSQANEKAGKEGVRVRFLLADVLALPQLEPFDFIFDRGCYHEVRMVDAKAYVETIRRLSRPGTRFLLLAGNPNELPRQYAPPQVAEEDIRSDFSPLFEIEWLEESRFETVDPSAVGPLAWSVMLRRKAKP